MFVSSGVFALSLQMALERIPFKDSTLIKQILNNSVKSSLLFAENTPAFYTFEIKIISTMKFKSLYLLSLCSLGAFAQNIQNNPGSNHGNKFEQLGTILPTPNVYRTASGAPGENTGSSVQTTISMLTWMRTNNILKHPKPLLITTTLRIP